MIDAARRRRALERLGAFTVEHEPLAPHTTYRLGGPAALYSRPRSLEELLAVAAVARDESLPLLVIGRGSNMLVADAGFAGVAVSLEQWRDEHISSIEPHTVCILENRRKVDEREKSL